MMENGFIRRLVAMVRKEFQQLLRDNSSILIGVALPILLILIIGYGISLDVKNVPVAVVLEDTSPMTHDVLSFMNGSDYFSPIYVTSMHEAKKLVNERKADAIVRVPPDFSANLFNGSSSLQLILYGVDSSTATVVKGYVQGAVKQWQELNKHKFANNSSIGTVSVESRTWFNDGNS
ncbi:MAG: ABC transporter permease, partial [Sporomusa sp.]